MKELSNESYKQIIMLRSFTLIFSILLVATFTTGQVEMVSVGENYTLQTFYSLSTGESTTIPSDSWDIAFTAQGVQDAGIMINESAPLSGTSNQLFVAPTQNWEDIIGETEIFVDSVAIYNPEENWTEGAFNSIKDPMSPFDYGWGAYNPQSHVIEGSKIFVVKLRNSKFIKLQITDLTSGVYNFRYANLDGTDEKTGSVSKNDANGPVVFFSLINNTIINVQSDYDLIFLRYSTPLDDGTGNFIDYIVMGTLLAPGVEAVKVTGIDPENISESDYENDYSDDPRTIGHDWKYFDFTSGWSVDFNRTHFIKTKSGDKYQITFYDFEGSSTGTTTFNKSLIFSTSTEENILDNAVAQIYPNPTSDFITFDLKNNSNANMTIVDASGRTLSTQMVTDKETVFIGDLPKGLYHIIVSTERDVYPIKLIKK